MAISVGSVSLDIVPNAKDFDSLLKAQLNPAAARMGDDLGKRVAESMQARLREANPDVKVGVDTAEATVKVDRFLADTKVKADAAGTTSGKSLGANLSKSAADSAGHGSPLIMAAVAGGILAGGPAVIAAAGLMMGGVAAVIAAQAPEVQQAATNVGHAFEDSFGNAAKVTIPFFVQALNTVRSSAGQLASEAAPAFQALQGPIDSTVQGVVNLAQNAMPGLVAAVKAGGPVFQGLETFLSDVGSGLGSFFTIISQHGAAAGTVFTALGSAMDSILPALGTILGEGAELGSMVLPPLAAVLGVVNNMVQALGPLLPGIALGFAAWKIAGTIGPMLGTLAANIETAGANAMVAVGEFTASAAAGEAAGAGFEIAAAGARGLETAMGPIGWALAGISLVLPALISGFGGEDKAQQQAAASAKDLTDAVNQANGAITEQVRQQAALSAQKDGLLAYAQTWGVSSQTIVDATLGQGDALDLVKAAAAQYASGQTAAASATDAHTSAGMLQRQGFQQNAQASDTMLGKLVGLNGATAAGVTNQQQLAAAMGTASDAAAINSQRLQAISNAASAAKTQINLFKDGLDQLTGKTVSLGDAQVAVTDATVGAETALNSQKNAAGHLTSALVDSKGALDQNTAAGAAAWKALTDLAGADNTLIGTMEQQGATTDAVTAKDSELRNSFIKTAEKMGFSAGAAQDLANKIYGIPDQRKTEILADTNPAQKAIDDFLNSNSSKVLHLKVGAVAADAGPAALARAAGLSGGGLANGGVIPGYAPGVDSVPAMLSPGEGVLVPEAVRGIGGAAAIQAINSTYSNRVQGFANGGIVVGMDADTSPAQSAVNNEVAAAVRLASKVMAAQANAPGAPSNPSGNAALGKVLAGFQGWGSGAEWDALYALWQRESGWRNTAQNPTSTAYGIPQFLNSTWASLGIAKTSDAASQINAGLKYIGQRFHDPIGAWAHETKFGWYDQGGELPPGPSLVYNGTGASELIAPKQTFEQVMSGASGGGPASFTGNLYLDSGEFLGKVRGIAQEEAAHGVVALRNALTY